MTSLDVDIGNRISEHELTFHNTIQTSVSSCLIGVYQVPGFMDSMSRQDDNMHNLIQKVRGVYGEDISNVQVLYVMSRPRPHAFFPKKLHRVEIADAIRGMTEKKCSVYIVFLEVVQHGLTTVILVTPPRAR